MNRRIHIRQLIQHAFVSALVMLSLFAAHTVPLTESDARIQPDQEPRFVTTQPVPLALTTSEKQTRVQTKPSRRVSPAGALPASVTIARSHPWHPRWISSTQRAVIPCRVFPADRAPPSLLS